MKLGLFTEFKPALKELGKMRDVFSVEEKFYQKIREFLEAWGKLGKIRSENNFKNQHRNYKNGYF